MERTRHVERPNIATAPLRVASELCGDRVRIVYFLASFPALRNTFVLRELDGLEAAGLGIDSVVGLLRPEGGIQHLRAERWVQRTIPRPGLGACVAAVGWWAFRRPMRLSAVAASVVRVNLLPRHRVRAGIASILLGAFHARRLSAARPVHIHAHFEIPTDTAWAVHRLTGVSFSFTVHTDEAITLRSLPRNAEAAALVVTPSVYTQRRIQGRVGQNVPVHVVRAAIPTSEYPFHSRAIPLTGPVRGVCVAGLEPCKGHADLLRALARGEGLERVSLDIVGDGPMRWDLERLVGELGLGPRVTFRGALTEDEVRRVLDAADVFVLAGTTDENGHHDNLPVALMEAMAAGVPVVASRIGGIPELVVDGVTGFLAEPGDVDDLRSALLRALDCDSIADVVSSARSTVEAEFDLGANAQRLALLLCEQAIGQPRPEQGEEARVL